MLLIQQTSTDPYFNIASEEYLLKNFSDDIFILYRNEPSIIVGKHQNTIAEINLGIVKSKNLKVVRRLSGGGTVYHDLGNLNYSFIANGSEGNLVDFKKFSRPIIDILQKLGVDAKLGGKNDIRVGDKKISGNAEHVYKNRVLHHGTLLFSSHLDDLNDSIKISPNTYTDKAVKSIRSNVANISDYLKEPITIFEFTDLIVNHIKQTIPSCMSYQFTINDIVSINDLVDTKYATREWNYGYSPTYTLSKRIVYGDSTLIVLINVEKGIIIGINFEGDYWNKNELSEFELILIGCPHDLDEISNRLSAINLDDYLLGITIDSFLMGLF